jgi:hypothetical protein
VDGGNQIPPFLIGMIEMGIDEVVRKAFPVKLLAHSRWPEALAQPLSHVGLRKPLLAQQAAPAQLIDDGDYLGIRMTPGFQLARQLEAAVLT